VTSKVAKSTCRKYCFPTLNFSFKWFYVFYAPVPSIEDSESLI